MANVSEVSAVNAHAVGESKVDDSLPGVRNDNGLGLVGAIDQVMAELESLG